jgi:uroporphyrinogen-III synthase
MKRTEDWKKVARIVRKQTNSTAAARTLKRIVSEDTTMEQWMPALSGISQKLAGPSGNNGLSVAIPKLFASGLKLSLVAVLTQDRTQKGFAVNLGWEKKELLLQESGLPVLSRLAEWIIKQREETVAVSDLGLEKEEWLQELARQVGARSLIGTSFEPFVVLGMGEGSREFTKEEEQVFGCLARLSGLAVEKIRREKEHEQISRELETQRIIERVIEALNEITRIVGSALELKEVLESIVKVVLQATGGDACLLYLYDEEKDELRLKASNTRDPGVMERIKLKIGEGITGWVAREKKPVAIGSNASQDPRFKFFHELPEDRYQAFLSAPMIHQGKFVGVINVQHQYPYQHSQYEIALLSVVAQGVGGVILNARLHELLETRKLVERAKGILMKEKAMGESDAFRLIQREAMNSRRSMREIAQAIIISAEIREAR